MRTLDLVSLSSTSRSPARPVAGDTWNISGPSFLSLYVPVAVVATLVATALVRSRAPRTRRPTPLSRELSPAAIGLLGGGDRLAVAVALAELRRQQVLDQTGRAVALAKTSPGTDKLTLAVHRTLVANRQRRIVIASLAGRPEVREALEDLRTSLRECGLLATAPTRRDARLALACVGVVLVVGVARVAAGLGNARPVGWLVIVLAIQIVSAAAVLGRGPENGPSGSGTVALRALRTEHAHLSPAMRPAWTTYGGASVVLGAAVFGGVVLDSADPAFARVIDAQAVVPTSLVTRSHACGYVDSGGGGCGSSSSGCGGGGSSCGGSSCGGGCGGGGCGG